ncbi:hypothetical protein GCM10011613_23630 [Cellvibrio zantedeschiae]|uniref:Uncharacterized protein n=1 Tax=Cellvibrio zantedeschiae TaxID=1237077 RepID=A0ABQ3B3Z1_9GAMM|nr:hypothetical protein [Cellvibrio zantedeschiae]GGY78283.1 hypothetical protein GCM10011613_23630 [Cellvibrio zantedeschiae]
MISMWLVKHKKKLILLCGIVLFLGLIYFLFIYYLVTNGFRNYQKFCSNYIPQIESYQAKHGIYPSAINDFEKPSFSWRYDAEECNYIADPDGFSFQVADGLFGISIYISKEKRWVYD